MKKEVIRVGPTPIWTLLHTSKAALLVKNPPANAGDIRDMVRPLGGEDALEEGMAIHSIVLVWRIPWREEPGRPQSTVSCKQLDTTEVT